MGADACNAIIVQFGVFELDSRNHELRRDGVRVGLAPHSFQLLQLLVSHPNDLVTRDEIRDALWPGESAGDFDGRTKFHIKRVREALGDHCESPVYVRTVRNNGYRFIAPVQAHARILHPDDRSSYWLGSWVALGCVPMLLLALAVYLWGGHVSKVLSLTTAAAFHSGTLNSPSITAVMPVLPEPVQRIVIRGHGFGRHAAFASLDSPYLAIRDKSAHWAAGRITSENVDEVTLTVASWTDSEIVVSAFSGAYGTHWWRLNAGDEIEVVVWNPQSGAGPASYRLQVSAGP